VNPASADVTQGALQLLQTDLQCLFVRKPRCAQATLDSGLQKLSASLLLRLRSGKVLRASSVALAFFRHRTVTGSIY
jgi:hypothetical protein